MAKNLINFDDNADVFENTFNYRTSDYMHYVCVLNPEPYAGIMYMSMCIMGESGNEQELCS